MMMGMMMCRDHDTDESEGAGEHEDDNPSEGVTMFTVQLSLH